MYKQFANLTLLNRIKIFCHHTLFCIHIRQFHLKNNIMRKKEWIIDF